MDEGGVLLITIATLVADFLMPAHMGEIILQTPE